MYDLEEESAKVRADSLKADLIRVIKDKAQNPDNLLILIHTIRETSVPGYSLKWHEIERIIKDIYEIDNV